MERGVSGDRTGAGASGPQGVVAFTWRLVEGWSEGAAECLIVVVVSVVLRFDVLVVSVLGWG